jgi:putative acetyltransferase
VDALSPFQIRAVDGPDPRVLALLQRHVAMMRAGTPEDSCHVMEPGDLFDTGARVFALWQDGEVLGIGALTAIGPDHGELKSMHTAQEARGRGVARAVLDRLITEAGAMGLSRLSLETGRAAAFSPAHALYAAAGFQECPPFGDYRPDPLSVFMTRCL